MSGNVEPTCRTMKAKKRWIVSDCTRTAKAHLLDRTGFGHAITVCGLVLTRWSGESKGDLRCVRCLAAEEGEAATEDESRP